MKKNTKTIVNYINTNISINKTQITASIRKAELENLRVDESTKIDHVALSTRAGS